MSLKQQYQRFLLSNAFFQSQRELHAEPNLLIEEGYDFSEQDNIQSEWVSYYYVPALDMAHECRMRKALVQCQQVKYIEIDHQTYHMAIYHDGAVEPLTTLLTTCVSAIHYQQTLSNFVPVTVTLTPVIQTTKILSWLSSIHIVLCIVTFCMAILASSLSLLAYSLLILMDAVVFLVANNAIIIQPVLKNRLIYWLGWLQLVFAAGLLFEIVHSFLNGHTVLAGFILLQGIIALTASVTSRLLIARDYVRNRPLHWSHLIRNTDVLVSVGLILTGFMIHISEKAVLDLIMAFLITGLVLFRVFHILVLNKLSLK